MNTREIIVRQLYTKRIRENYTQHEARLIVFWKTGHIIPFNEAKKLTREALILCQN